MERGQILICQKCFKNQATVEVDKLLLCAKCAKADRKIDLGAYQAQLRHTIMPKRVQKRR